MADKTTFTTTSANGPWLMWDGSQFREMTSEERAEIGEDLVMKPSKRPSRVSWFHAWLAFCLGSSISFTVLFNRAHNVFCTVISSGFTLFIAALLGASLAASSPSEPKNG